MAESYQSQSLTSEKQKLVEPRSIEVPATSKYLMAARTATMLAESSGKAYPKRYRLGKEPHDTIGVGHYIPDTKAYHDLAASLLIEDPENLNADDEKTLFDHDFSVRRKELAQKYKTTSPAIIDIMTNKKFQYTPGGFENRFGAAMRTNDTEGLARNLAVEAKEKASNKQGGFIPRNKEIVDQLRSYGRDVQTKLIEKGHDVGKVDGVIGPKTKSAIKKFQSENGLKPDGSIGPKTFKGLLSSLNPFHVGDASADEIGIEAFEDLGAELVDEAPGVQEDDFSDLGAEYVDESVNEDDFSDLGAEYIDEPVVEEPKKNIAQAGIESLFKIKDLVATKGMSALNKGVDELPAVKLKEIRESFKRGEASATIDQASYRALIGELDFDKDVKPLKDAQNAIATADPIKGKNAISSAIYAVSSMSPALMSGMAQGAGVGAGAGLLTLAGGATAPLALGAFGVGQAYGSFEYWRKQGAGQLYADLKYKEIPDEVAKPTAHIAGALYGAVEFSQAGKLIPGFEELSKRYLSDSIQKTVARMAAVYGVDWLQEVGEEGLQAMVMSAAEETASKIADKSDKSTAKIVKDVIIKGWDEAKESALPMLLLMAPRAAMEGVALTTEVKGESIKSEVRKAMAQKVIEQIKSEEKETAKLDDVSTDVAKPAETFSVNVTPEMEGAVDSGLPAVEIKEVETALEKSNLPEERRAEIIRRLEATEPITATKEEKTATDAVKEETMAEAKAEANQSLQQGERPQDFATAEEYVASKGIQSSAEYYETQGARDLAHRFKNGDQEAIKQMATEMVQNVPDNAILIPVPSRSGKATNTLKLAEEIQKLKGNGKIVSAVEGKIRESLYDMKKAGKKVDDAFFGFRVKNIPNGDVFLVDGVYSTGQTTNAIKKIIPNAKVLVHSIDKSQLTAEWQAAQNPQVSKPVEGQKTEQGQAADIEKELKQALDSRRKEIASLRKKANKSRAEGSEEKAQIYEGMIRDYMSVDESEFKKDFRANPDYYIKSNIDPFLRFKNKEVNRAKPDDKRSIQEIKDDAKQSQTEAKKEPAKEAENTEQPVKEQQDEEIQRSEQAESVSGRPLPVEEGGTDSSSEFRIIETEDGLELFDKNLYKKDPIVGKMHEKQIEAARKVLAMSVDEIYDLETKDGGMELLEEAGTGIYSLKDYTEEELETISDITYDITIGKRSIIDEMVAFKVFENRDLPASQLDETSFKALYGNDKFGYGFNQVNIQTASPSYFVHDAHFFNLLDAVRDKFPKITALNLPQAVKELKKFKTPIEIYRKIKQAPVAVATESERVKLEDEKPVVESEWEKTKRELAEAQVRWEKDKAEKSSEPVKPSVPAADKQKSVKLRTIADNMESLIDSKVNSATSKQNPTARRARVADKQYEEGMFYKKVQSILRSMSNESEAGTLPAELSGINSRSIIEDILRKNKYPDLSIHKMTFDDVLKAIQGKPGSVKLRQDLGYTDSSEYRTKLTPKQLPVFKQIVALASKSSDSYTVKHALDEIKDYERVKSAGINNQEEYDAVKQMLNDRAEGLSEEQKRARKIKELESKFIGVKMPGFFPTPRETAIKIIDLADIQQGMKVLEPSAGMGGLADIVKDRGADVETYEKMYSLQELLKEKGHNVVGGDFMEASPEPIYDRVVMNPPFENMQDVDHVMRAFEFLKPGGKLVAITSESPFFRDDKKAQDFRAFVDENGYSEKLPEGSFKSSFVSTGVNTRVVVLDKAEVETVKEQDDKIPSYGYDRVKMSENLTMQQLTELNRQIENDPKNKNNKGGIYLYTKEARKKMEDIAWAITYKLKEKKVAEQQNPAEPEPSKTEEKAQEKEKAVSKAANAPNEQPKSVSEVEKALGETSIDDNIITMNLGMAPVQSARKMVNDDIKGVVQFSDPEVEARFKKAKGVNVISLKNKLKAFLADMKARTTRTYPTLPNKPEYAEIRNILSKQQVNRAVSNERAIRALDAITAGFAAKKLDLFTRKVILDDLAREIEAGRAIPFGYSRYSEDGGVITDTYMFAKDKANIDYLVDQNDDVKEALSKRKMLWEAIQSDLVSYGVLDEQQVKQDYFRHQVLDYARLKATLGTGKKLRTPTPGYARRRGGSTLDINTDYVQAEFEVMAQAMHDIETAKNIRKIEDSRLNIVSNLRAQAKEQSKETGEKVDWHTLIPDGYTTWQPREGNVFYMANSVSDKVLNAALENLTGMGIDPQDLKKVMAVGSKRKEFVLPEDVATTLDNLYKNKDVNAIAEWAKTVTNYWKRWILSNPRRAFKYNYQNFISDFDAVVAGDPRILKQFGKSFSELSDVIYRGKPMPVDMKEFFERGGLSAQMTVNELPELRNLEIFQRLLDKSPAGELKRQLNLWQKYWQGINTFTTFREAIFRYAAYLHYKNMYTGNGKVNYGASIKSEIDNISDPLDKAAKVATELLGDYANLTAFGKDMREAVAPFYSWLEINAKRYSRLTRNAFSDGWQKGIKTSATIAGIKGSFFLAGWMVRAAAMTALIALYNHLRFPDEEEELSEYDRNRMHIVLGRNPDGTIAIIRGQTAFADLLEWFGLDAAPTLWREYLEGKTSLADIYGRIPFTDLPAFGLLPFSGKIGMHQAAMKFIRGINPLYKLPVETMTGNSLPVFDDRSYKIDDKFRNIAKAISLENEYDLITRKPSRGYFKSWLESVITTSDPDENAYRYIQGEKYKFLETVKGRGGSGDYYSPRSLVYREYKKALKFKDERAIKEARLKLAQLKVSDDDIAQSLASADPVSGLNANDKEEFIVKYLSDKDRRVLLPRARKYYYETFRKSP